MSNVANEAWHDYPMFVGMVHSPSQSVGTTIRYREYYCQHSDNTSGAYWNHHNGVNADTNYTNKYYNGFVMEIAQ